jgi:regulator of protease activity HflC (stomatin/prohibitin superfamily)
MDMTTFVTTGIIAVILFMLVSAAVKIVQEYERGVIFRLGRLVAARGPASFSSSRSSKPCARWTCA